MTSHTDKSHEGRTADCLFCKLLQDRNREIITENVSFIAVFDNFPVNEGHTLIISKRHVPSVFDLMDGEGADLLQALKEVRAQLDERFEPDGYNVGINSGRAGGQTVPHLHVHLIPRYVGDVENPRGGIRNFKPALVPY